MANVIVMPDGRNETIFSEQDFMDVLEKYMGSQARRWLEDWMGENDDDADYTDDLEKETDSLRASHKEAMTLLRTHSETIARLIREKEIDRKALSATVGSISCITWKEVNR